MDIKNLKKRKEVINFYRRVDPICESEPERLLYEKFIKAGVRPQKQYEIHGFFVDMAFPENKVAIEYDGLIHQDKLLEDEERHKIIRGHGWNIARIRNEDIANGYVIYLNEKRFDHKDRDMEKTMDIFVSIIVQKVKKNDGDTSDGFSPVKVLLRDFYQKLEEKMSNTKK